MADKEEKGDMFSKMKDYPEVIKGVTDDSQKLIETQNEVMTEKFGDMRTKITQSIKKLHLGVIEKTVENIVQSIIDKDLVIINKTVNAQFMSKFSKLLGNLMENVDEIMSVGKVMDAIETVNEYINNLAYDDALALLDLTIVLIRKPELDDQKQNLIGKKKEVEGLKKIFDKNIKRLNELEEEFKKIQDNPVLLNEIIEFLEEVIQIAPLVGKKELIAKYSPKLENTRRDLEEIKKATIIANENFDLLVKNEDVVDAHELVEEYKKKWVIYLKEPPIPTINELLSKEEEIWKKWGDEQDRITGELENFEAEIHEYEDNDDYVSADEIWESIQLLLIDLWDVILKRRWEQIEIIYQIKKKVFEALNRSTELAMRFAFEEAFTILNVAIDLVAGKNLIEHEVKLKKNKDDVYAAQARYVFLNRKLKRLEKKFNENFYNNYYIAAIDYAKKIVEISEQVGADELAETYKEKVKELEQKLAEIATQQLKEQEELKKDLEEVKDLIDIDEDVLPLLDKFSTNDILGDLSGDIDEMLSQVSSLLGQNRVEVGQEIAKKAILKTAGGEVIEKESEITVQKLGDEDTESIFYSAQSTIVNTYKDTIEEALLTDLIPYNFEITNIEINGKAVEQLPDKTLTKDGLELKWKLENISPREKVEITYDLRRRISRTIVFILEGELKIIKTHSNLNKLQMEGFYDAEIPFNNTYGKNLEGVVIEDIIPLYYVHIIKEPTNILPTEVTTSKNGELVKWELGTLEQKNLDYRYRLLELYRFEEIKIQVDKLNKSFLDSLEKNDLARAVDLYHEIGKYMEEYHTTD